MPQTGGWRPSRLGKAGSWKGRGFGLAVRLVPHRGRRGRRNRGYQRRLRALLSRACRRHSFLRHAGLAQAIENSSLGKETDARGLVTCVGSEASKVRPRVFATQPLDFGEFGGGSFALAFEGVRGSEVRMRPRQPRIGAQRLFEPEDCFIDAKTRLVLVQHHEAPAGSPIRSG
jgi:hypothetical protein